MSDATSLPVGWVSSTIGQWCVNCDSRRIPINSDERKARLKGKADSELFPYYGATGQVGRIDGYLFDGEYVLIGEDGAPFLEAFKNKAYMASGRFWVNNHAHILAPSSHPKYVCHYLNQFRYADHVTGTTRLKLTKSALEQIPIPVAPFNEQRRIVEKIEELFSELDQGIENLKQARAQLAVYRQALLKHAFEGKLTADWRKTHASKLESADQLLARVLGRNLRPLRAQDAEKLPPIPQGWAYTYLSNVGQLARGKSKHRPRNAAFLFGGPYPFIQTGEVKAAGRVIRTYENTLSEEGLKQSKLWPEGTLCITIAANIAQTAFLGFDACFPDSVVGFTACKDAVEPEFVDMFIRGVRTRIEAYAPATAQRNINLTTLENLVVPLAPVTEQKALVASLSAQLSILDQTEADIDINLQKSEALRQSILKKAFAGELVPQDPADEPAAALFARIRAERAAQPNKPARKKKAQVLSKKS